MRALDIRRNGQPLALVGAANAFMFSADISVSIEDTRATLDVRGMNDLGAERTSHTSWVTLQDLASGDTIAFALVQSETFTPPSAEVASDSQEHLDEQQKYREQLDAEPLHERPMVARSPNATVQLTTHDAQRYLAVFEGGRKFISFHVLWNQRRPDQCRLSLRSFSQKEALERLGAREWYEGILYLGQRCEVKVDA